MPASKRLDSYGKEFFLLSKVLTQTKKDVIDLPCKDPLQFRRQWYGFLSALEGGDMDDRLNADRLRKYAVQEKHRMVKFVMKVDAGIADAIAALIENEGTDLSESPQFELPGNMPGISTDDIKLPGEDEILSALKKIKLK